MQRAIIGYHQDTEGDWVAELSCGHDQHIRHRPPFQVRPWTQTPAGRVSRIGQPLECRLCDRAEPPANLRLVRAGVEWDEHSLAAGLRHSHRLGPRSWGRIHVYDGRLQFSMGRPPVDVELVGGSEQAIPPEMDHTVRPIGKVRFSVDLLATDRGRTAHTRSALDHGGDPACWVGLVCPGCGALLDGSGHRPGCPEPGCS